MICKQCNNNVPNDSEYCPFCGNIVNKVSMQSNSVSDIQKGYTYLELKEWKKAREVFDFAIVNNDNKAKASIGRLLVKFKLTDLESLTTLKKKLTKFDDFNMAVKYADDNYKQQLKKYYSLVEETIAKRKAKAKKRAFITVVLCASLVAISALSYFVFIPVGRCFYYENLLSNGSIKKAIRSYSDSEWFEYDGKVKELFYKKGVSLVEAKNYKKAESCFNITDNFKDSVSYLNYCKAQILLAENNLEAYDYFIKCRDFLDSKKMMEKINETKELYYKKGVSLVEVKDYKNAEYYFGIIENLKDSTTYYNYCKAQILLTENNLEAYDYFLRCRDFLDSNKILQSNEKFIILNKLQGEWESESIDTGKSGKVYIVPGMSVSTGRITIKVDGSYVYFDSENDKYKIEISGDEIKIDYRKGWKIRIKSNSVFYTDDGEMPNEIKWEKK